MTIGTDQLEQMISGTYAAAPCGHALLLPPPSEFHVGYVKCIHSPDKKFTNRNGALFGGYLSALLDNVSDLAARTVIPDDKMCVTAELAISYFRPCMPENGDLLLEGTVINQSRRSYHIEVTIKQANGKLIAKAHAIQAISDR